MFRELRFLFSDLPISILIRKIYKASTVFTLAIIFCRIFIYVQHFILNKIERGIIEMESV